MTRLRNTNSQNLDSENPDRTTATTSEFSVDGNTVTDSATHKTHGNKDSGLEETGPEKNSMFASTSVLGWLAFWFAIALLVRFTNLASKPAWMDEVSTVMFSLGNSSRFIPTDQVIDLNQILVGLRLRPEATAMDAANYLLQENNHPPAYFMIAHWWMQLFHALKGSADGYASLWAARALPAFFGALAVPATYILSWISFRDLRRSSTQSPSQVRSIGLVGAALMAVSPYSVFLSQEARHYTLAILMVIASLVCFALAVKAVWSKSALAPDESAFSNSLGWTTVIAWIVINTFSIAVHYFCGIAICAEGLLLLIMLVRQCRNTVGRWRQRPWLKIYVTAMGSLAGALVWLPILLNFYGSPQTTYIQAQTRTWKFWVEPIVQSIVGWLYALFAPITSGFGWQRVTAIVITSAVLLFLYTPWLLRSIKRGLTQQWAQRDLRPGLLAIGGFFVVSNALYLLICYVVGFDITRGHRYVFAYFPSIIVSVGAGLAYFWPDSSQPATPKMKLPFLKRHISGRAFVTTVVVIGFLGAQVIAYDFTHLKFYEADRFVNKVRATSTYPAVVGINAIVGDQPSVIGNEIVSVAWEVQRQLAKGLGADEWQSEPKFIITVDTPTDQNTPTEKLAAALEDQPRPFDLWLLNTAPDLDNIQCTRPADSRSSTGSFRSTHYICEAS